MTRWVRAMIVSGLVMFTMVTAAHATAQITHLGDGWYGIAGAWVISEQSLATVYFPTALYLNNVTQFTATFNGFQAGTPAFTFNLTFAPDKGGILLNETSRTLCGSSCITSQFSLTLGSSPAESRYWYRFQNGNWHSENRTVDVVDQYHLLFVNNLQVAQDALDASKTDGVAVDDARQQYALATGYADQGNWNGAYHAVLLVKPMVQHDYELYYQHRDSTLTAIFGGFGAFALGLVGIAAYQMRRDKQRRSKTGR